MATNAAKDPTPPDLSHPSMRSWLETLPARQRPGGGLRDAHLVVARQRGQGDPEAAGGSGLPPGWQGRALHRRGQVWPAAHRRAGAGQGLGRGACPSNGGRSTIITVILACLGQAVEQDERVHAIRNWHNQLIVFDDVDVMLTIEMDVGSEKFPLVRTSARHQPAYSAGHAPGDTLDPGQPGRQRGRARRLMRWFYRRQRS